MTRTDSTSRRAPAGDRTLRRMRRILVAAAAALAVVAGAIPSSADIDFDPGAVSRVSVTSTGGEANGASGAVGDASPTDGDLACQLDFFGFICPLDLGPTPQSDALPAMSADASEVAFTSVARNLVTGDTNDWADVFIRERDPDADGVFDEGGATITRRMSLASDGSQANRPSFWPALSSDSRYVAFASQAWNLVAGDGPGPLDASGVNESNIDIFLRDRDADGDGLFDEIDTGATSVVRVSLKEDGTEAPRTNLHGSSFAPVVSDNGSHVAFASWAQLAAADTNTCGPAHPAANVTLCSDIYAHNLDVDGPGGLAKGAAGNTATVLISKNASGVVGNGASGSNPPYFSNRAPAMTPDGRYIAFSSKATNLTPADPNGSVPDVFVVDRDTDADGILDEAGATSIERVEAPALSNGRLYRSVNPSLSADGRYVAYEAMDSQQLQGFAGVYQDLESRVFIYDRTLGTTAEAAVNGAGRQAETRNYGPTISGDGRFVSFTTAVSNTSFGHDSGDVRTEVYLFDRDADENGVFDEEGTASTSLLRVSAAGFAGEQVADASSYGGQISRDGSAIGFISFATNLMDCNTNLFICSDNNSAADVYVRERGIGLCLELICTL